MSSDARRFPVTAELRHTLDEIGPAAERWLARVPGLVAETAAAWDLETGAPLGHDGYTSLIFPATTREGDDAILKVSVPHDEARREADALVRWDGDGAVRLLRSSDDGFTLLLERCDPGHDLWSSPLDEHVEVLADLLPRLWIDPPPDARFPELAATAAGWEEQMPAKAAALELPAAIGEDARRWSRELRKDQPRRLLHGDLHPGNVLAAGREPWLAIDPKPWVGDPAFDLAQTLANWIRVGPDDSEPAVATILTRASQISAALALDLPRVLRWAVVKALGWDSGRTETQVLHAAAVAA